MRWEHPQLGLASADADSQECNHLAWRESWRSSYAFGYWGYPGPFWGYPGGFRGYPGFYRGAGRRLYPYPLYQRDPWFEEMRLRDYCMRSKGYRMVPVPG